MFCDPRGPVPNPAVEPPHPAGAGRGRPGGAARHVASPGRPPGGPGRA